MNEQEYILKNKNLLHDLSSYLFWDYNVNILNPDIDKKLILERVFTRGTENDEKKY